MTTEERVREILGQAIAEFVNSTDFQDLIAGRLGPAQVRAFVRNLFLPHYQSAHILAFAFPLHDPVRLGSLYAARFCPPQHAEYGAERIWGGVRGSGDLNNAAFCAVELALLLG